MFKWLVYSLILSNPTASMILLALFIIGVFSVKNHWDGSLDPLTCMLKPRKVIEP